MFEWSWCAITIGNRLINLLLMILGGFEREICSNIMGPCAILLKMIHDRRQCEKCVL